MMSAGAMFLVFLGRPSSSATGPTDQGHSLRLFGAMFKNSWCDLVDEGFLIQDAGGWARRVELHQQQQISDTNSWQYVQSKFLKMMLHALEETLDKIQLPRQMGKKPLLTAADLGCSCGHNTLVIADVIVHYMTKLCGTGRDRNTIIAVDPEFCFYFSDLPSNDFNTLFHLLPNSDDSTGVAGGRSYFAAAVPGSFHGRLFPERSINVFTSTFSLQWLSQVPEEVVDKRSVAYNKGKVFVHDASVATGEAYQRQFQSDMARFLRCRATELKHGGVVFLICLGRQSSADPTNQGCVQLLYGVMFEESWSDLVKEGMVDDGSKMDSFNVPVYAATLEEFRETIDANGSFQVNRLELVMGIPPVVNNPKDRRAVGLTVANYLRSLLGPLVDANVGRALADELFIRVQRHAEVRTEGLLDEMHFPHIGGQGESSYLKNSQAQSQNLQMMMHALEETLEKVHLHPRGPGKLLLTAADLGCSCGRNTLIIADAIVQHITKLCHTYRGKDGDNDDVDPEFFFYFSDLPNNDFNTLFHLLPQHAAAADDGNGRRYFAAAVPGSFHDRLFPERSINVFTSTFCLHWLSQVPKEVADKLSPAYNKGKVFVHSASEETGVAYRRQFQSDMARFLRCRAKEMKPGGAMFLVFLGRPSSSTGPTDQGHSLRLFGAMFEDSWRDLIGEGIVDAERMDSFNVPSYAATLEEFREVVDDDGSFVVNRLELVMGGRVAVDGDSDDRRAVGRRVANNQRSVFGPLVEAHIGKALADELFVRVQSRAEACAEEIVDEMRVHMHIVCSLSLA
uniref:Jasmonate O-methyltransferase n=1 Tax=Leersia perrieri TaxID=77586 RepID=A0A0D9WAV6_9ORYZ